MAESMESVVNKALFVNGLGKDTALFESLIREFTGDVDCSSQQSYTWPVDNKYYSADILCQFCHFDQTVQVDIDVDSYEAMVIVTPHPKGGAPVWSDICSQLCNNGAPAVCILVAALQDSTDSADLQPMLKWCIENGFEMIEWMSGDSPERHANDDSDDEQIGGTVRLAEALQAHIWPAMTMKGHRKSDVLEPLASRDTSSDVQKPLASRDTSSDVQEPLASSNTSSYAQEPLASSNTSPGRPERCADSAIPSGLLTEDDKLLAVGVDGENDPGGESFEQLFTKFADMKAHAQQLTHEERKAYAEKVVLAFWDAIGGDEDEIKD